MADNTPQKEDSASSEIVPYETDTQPVMDLAARDTTQVLSTLESGSFSTGISQSYGIAGGNFGGANLGNVTHNITNIVYQAPSRQSDDHDAGPSADVNQARQNSSSSDELIFVNAIKAFKNKPLHSEKEIYEGEKRTAIGQTPVAVKLVKHSDRALKEAKSLHTIDSHPNVVKVVDSDIHVEGKLDYVFIAMELCSKETLYDYIVNHKKEYFDPNRALRHATQIISGLKYIHSKNIIHRDLKPSNILFSRDEEHPYEEVKITDFGLSKQTDNFATSQTNPGAGTHGYKAPEVINEEKVSPKSDIFSLGVLLYFRLSNGQHPYGEKSLKWDYAISEGKEPFLKGLLIKDKKIRKKVESILRRMLRYDPVQRPTAAEIFDEWKQINFSKGFVQTMETGHQELCQANTSTKPLGGRKVEERTDKYLKKPVDNKDEKTLQVPCIVLFHSGKLSTVSGSAEQEYQLKDVANLPTIISSIAYAAVCVARNVYFITSIRYVFRLSLDDLASGWCRVHSTNYEHKYFPPAGVLNGYIYSIGGQDKDQKSLKSVERYDPEIDEWQMIRPMIEQRYSAASTVFKGKIYVLGGLNKRRIPKTAEYFDPTIGTWTLLPFQMTRGRCYFISAVVLNEKIHALGGADTEDWMEILDLDEGAARKVDMGLGRIYHETSFALN